MFLCGSFEFLTVGIMFVIIWKYKVKAEFKSEFEKLYGKKGEWVYFFEKSPHYFGTELMKDAAFYITIDRWDSKKNYDQFLNLNRKEFKIIDKKGEKLTESETLIGKYETINNYA
jgi:heme-degrading monooxygenase HmoA